MNCDGKNCDVTLVILPEEEWTAFKQKQDQILVELSNLIQTKEPTSAAPNVPAYVTAKEFIAVIKIKRTKFDSLVAANRIKTIKKGRRIYLPFSEIDRYFKDSKIL